MAALEPPVLMAPVIASQHELWMRRRGRVGAEPMAALEAPFLMTQVIISQHEL